MLENLKQKGGFKIMLETILKLVQIPKSCPSMNIFFITEKKAASKNVMTIVLSSTAGMILLIVLLVALFVKIKKRAEEEAPIQRSHYTMRWQRKRDGSFNPYGIFKESVRLQFYDNFF